MLVRSLMADAIAESAASDTPVIDALHRVAHAHGRSLGDSAVTGSGTPAAAAAALALAAEILGNHGYEPRRDDGRVVMANCPFHALARAQTDLVCRMNHALIAGVTEALGPLRPLAGLEPAPDRCCVVLRQKND